MTTPDLVAELRAAIEAQSHPEIMTPAQAAVFLGVSEDYLRDHRKAQSGPPIQTTAAVASAPRTSTTGRKDAATFAA